MKILLALALVALCQAGPSRNNVPTRLSAPSITHFSSRTGDLIVFEVFWTPVQSGIWTDPVIGYKVRVWEVPNAISANAKEYTTPDGNHIVKVEEGLEEESMDVTKNSQILLEEIRTPADLHRAAFFNVQRGVTYRFRISAYTERAQSAYSLSLEASISSIEPNPAVASNSVTITL